MLCPRERKVEELWHRILRCFSALVDKHEIILPHSYCFTVAILSGLGFAGSGIEPTRTPPHHTPIRTVPGAYGLINLDLPTCRIRFSV
jgi:hypothetical protein